MNRKELEIRRRKVQELLLKGYTQQKIAEKLGVHFQTIHKDVKALNKRYKKLVAENPEYLNKQLEKVFKFIDHFSTLIAEYWELKEKASEFIEVKDKKGNIKKIPMGSLDDQRKALDSIRSCMVEQAKVLKLIGGNNNYINQNYVHIEQINNVIVPVMNFVKDIINLYVPEEKRVEALTKMKEFIEAKKEKELKETKNNI